jgi:hypothetical protein
MFEGDDDETRFIFIVNVYTILRGMYASRDGFLCAQAAYIKRLRSSFAHRRVHTTWQEI